MSSSGEPPKYGPNDIEPGDWIKYRSGVYGSGRLAEVHALGADVHSGAFCVTTEGIVLFDRILEVRRRPLNVLVLPAGRREVGAMKSGYLCVLVHPSDPDLYKIGVTILEPENGWPSTRNAEVARHHVRRLDDEHHDDDEHRQ